MSFFFKKGVVLFFLTSVVGIEKEKQDDEKDC